MKEALDLLFQFKDLDATSDRASAEAAVVAFNAALHQENKIWAETPGARFLLKYDSRIKKFYDFPWSAEHFVKAKLQLVDAYAVMVNHYGFFFIEEELLALGLIEEGESDDE